MNERNNLFLSMEIENNIGMAGEMGQQVKVIVASLEI